MNSYTKIISISISTLLIGCSKIEYPNSKYKKLGQYLDMVSEHQKAMGTVLIFEKGETKFIKNYGFKKLPKTPIYRIGSISKTYTAVIIARLVEEGLLKYEDKVAKFYPTIPNAKKITIEQLLQHRSGLVNFTSRKDYMSYAEKPSTESQHIIRAIKNGTNFKPDKKYAYSNTGYVFLSLIAQKVSNKSFSELLEEYIAQPLNLKSTYLYDAKRPRADEVISYEKGEKWTPSTNTHQTVPLGAGAIASNAQEVAQFFHALFNGKLVSKKALERMRNMKDGYGHALINLPYDKKIGLGHTGGIDGFRSIAAYFPDSDLVFVQLSNASAMEMNNVSIAMLASFYGDYFDLPEFKVSKVLEPAILNKYVGTFKADDFPLDIRIFVKNNALYAQADGQSPFPLEAYSEIEFAFPPAKIKIVFNSDGKSFDFTQEKTFNFKKED